MSIIHLGQTCGGCDFYNAGYCNRYPPVPRPRDGWAFQQPQVTTSTTACGEFNNKIGQDLIDGIVDGVVSGLGGTLP